MLGVGDPKFLDPLAGAVAKLGIRRAVLVSGYEIRWNDQAVSVAELPVLKECLQAGCLCNDAQLVRQNGRLVVQGDPTEGALIAAAQKARLDETELHAAQPRLDAIPFESEHQYMATLHGQPEGARVVYMKGAVERLLERCATALGEDGNETPLDKERVHRETEVLASQGLRVLAFARKRMPARQRGNQHFLGRQIEMVGRLVQHQESSAGSNSMCAITSRAFSPPESTRHFFSTSSPEKPKQPASVRNCPWPACGKRILQPLEHGALAVEQDPWHAGRNSPS